MKHRPSKTSHIYIFLYKDPKNQAKRSFKEILSSDPPSSKRNVLRRTRFRRLDCPSSERVQKFTVTLKSIMKVYYETVAWLSRVHKLPSSSSSSSSSRRRSGERRDPRKGRETTVEYREQQLGGKTKKERRRRRRKRGGSVGGVCSLLPGDRVHRLLRCRCPEIKNLREPGRSDNRRWDSLFHRKLIGEIGWRGKKEDLDEIYYPSEGEGRTLIVEECSSPGNRVELARSAFRNGKHCCTLYPGLHKPGTPHSANSRGLLSSREFSAQRWFKRE